MNYHGPRLNVLAVRQVKQGTMKLLSFVQALLYSLHAFRYVISILKSNLFHLRIKLRTLLQIVSYFTMLNYTQCATGSKILTKPEPDRMRVILAGTGPDYKPE